MPEKVRWEMPTLAQKGTQHPAGQPFLASAVFPNPWRGSISSGGEEGGRQREREERCVIPVVDSNPITTLESDYDFGHEGGAFGPEQANHSHTDRTSEAGS